MRKYFSPRINAVVLHAEQTVLAICKVNGIYMYAVKATTACWYGTTTHGVGNTCVTAVRGRSATISAVSESRYAQPS